MRSGKIALSIVAFAFLLLMGQTGWAQTKPATEKVVIGGKEYMLYTVAKGDTPYSIIKAFGITPDQFEAANPEAKGSIVAGQKIKIPVTEEVSSVKPRADTGEQDADKFIYHSVARKETLFSIAKKYKVAEAELFRYNPELKSGLKNGQVIRIPKLGTAKSAEGLTLHRVEKQETLYSIAKKYNLTQEEILEANPNVRSVIKKGMVLNIPAPKAKKNPPRIADVKLTEYQLVSGDTFFNLKQRFGISEEVLKRINPDLDEGLKAGTVIYIPDPSIMGGKPDEPAAEKAELSEKNNDKVLAGHAKGELFKIGLLLPVGINPLDSVKVTSKTSSFLGLYQGALLATDRMVQSGARVKVYVYDTESSASTVESVVRKPEFSQLNLIIGPVYPDNQKQVSAISAQKQIPMVSPLAPEDTYVGTNPYYFQVNPAKHLRLVTTADYVAREFSHDNIVVLARSNGSADSKLVTELVRGKFTRDDKLAPNVHFYNIWNEGGGGLNNLLKPDQQNVIVMAETNEVNVSVAMNRLNSLSKQFNFVLVGIQDYTRLQSIDIEHLHNVCLRYLSPYFIDYTQPAVIEFVETYRREFGTEPTPFSFQGYDAVTYFLKALDQASKGDTRGNQVSNPGLLQADYHFQQVSDAGGFMNRSFFVIEYDKKYEVKVVGKIKGLVEP